ncbi:sensor domain-containing protein [Mycolicibacterium tokaiense]|uniref:Serine/threonine protein kinase n=1 Tax=Mycolicibacterium tokaiense TaxID=39695 RepID=A0A378TF47_9MYCO|nr:sensor domain-containing protein [Mycolicibacterium tokaiense]STZ59431.1 serine/threonine protein kinase [Mycolicibacterium tokaiense]
MHRCCALGLAGVLLLSGCASAPGTAVWSGSRVDDADLPALLLTADQVGEITGVELPEASVADTYLTEGVPADCRWAWEPAVEDTYVDAAPTGVAHAVLYTPDGSGLQVHQALVTVANEATADTFLAALPDSWTACADAVIETGPRRRVTGVAPGYQFGGVVVDEVGRTVSISRTSLSSGSECQRTVTTRTNVIVDVSVCGDTAAGQLETIVERLADNVET